MPKQTNNLTGATGEYYVCAELGRQGILALLTPKNNPLFDVIATNVDATKIVSIQVKTMGLQNTQGWKLGMDICTPKNNKNLYVVLVNLTSDTVDYYIFKYDDLSKRIVKLYETYLNTLKRNGEKRKDTTLRWFNLNQFTEKERQNKNNGDVLGFNPISRLF
ncbi:MAG: aspartate-ammonia lyase [Bacteroidetes bacterium]|nr:aspartate-ammonia lyase [Bacteroidota bacterium]